MSDVSKRIEALSPEKRALLELLLKQKSGTTGADQPIRRRAVSSPCPLSFAQGRLWYLDQFAPNNAVYNIPKAMHLRGSLDYRALQQALDSIVARHETLRTTFRSVEGTPLQVIAAEARVQLRTVVLDQDYGGIDDEKVRRVLREETQRPFDLTRDLMLRATLFRLGPEEYILVLVMHHIASDGWSMGVLFREFTHLYTALAEGKSPSLPELSVQYADYAEWQREWFQGEVLDRQLNYWKKQLSGIEVLQLPTDRPRPPVQTSSGSREPVILPEELSDSLRRLSRQERTSLFMTLMAAFQSLLYRYTAQSVITVGTPIANRTRTETEELIGFFVNTLVLRADLSDDLSFRQLLSQVRETALDAYEHQDLPFEKLVESLQPERSLNRTPLFQVMFVLQNAPTQSLVLPGLTVRLLDLGIQMVQFDLSLDLWEQGRQIAGAVEYNTDLFDVATVRRIIGHYQTLLEAVVQDPDLKISQVRILTETERRQVVEEWNEIREDYPKVCIHELFEAQADRIPDTIAVVFENQQLTYRELNEQANCLAHHLRGLGVGPDMLVGIYTEKSLEMAVSLLAVLKAGGAYVSLDPTYPKKRLAFLLEDARLGVLLTQTSLLGRLPQHQAQVICVDAFSAPEDAATLKNIKGAATHENLAFVIYTSGSTGRPKGTLISHRGVVNESLTVANVAELRPGDRVLQFHSLSFDAAAEELFPTWAAGATLVLRPDRVTDSMADFVRFVAESQLSVLDLPTSYWHEWVLELSHSGTQVPSSVRLVIVGGEQALADRFAAWQRKVNGRVRWMNGYGPTEATIASTFYEPEPGREFPAGGGVPIGRPIPNTRAYVLDRHLEPVPVGFPGELHIGGNCLALGYLNRPDLTAARFIPNPFTKEAGARLYKTGDLARWLPDGNLEFLGRIDHQVKVRGFRVELGEIEATLAEHPSIKMSAVLAREEQPGGNRLVAYVVPKDGHALTSEEVRNFVKQRLPNYMTPSRVHFLESMPMTVSSKVDRRALSELKFVPSEPREEEEAPKTPMEILLAEIWQELLGLDQVSVRDNFFDLGGHSLLSMKVIAKVERRTGVRIKPDDVMFQTLQQIAARCEEQQDRPAAVAPQGRIQRLSRSILDAVLQRKA